MSTVRSLVLHLRLGLLLVAVELGIRFMPLPRLCRLLGVTLDLTAPVGPPQLEPLPWWCRPRLAAIERLLRHWPWDATCLRRSLLQADALRSLRPVMRLGIRAGSKPIVAHAWLEVDGHSLERDVSDLLILQGSL
jgi:hypothetical protein